MAIWRLLQVKVPLTADVGGKDSVAASPGLLDAVCKALRADRELISESDVAVVRKSFDARDKSSPCFVYTVDVPDSAARRAKARGLRVKPGILEPAPPQPPNILHVQHAAGQ